MSKPIIHDTFSMERTFPAAPARVFAAWANPEHKAKWFVGPAGWTLQERTQDFREGGTETVQGVFPDGVTVSRFNCHYLSIIPNQRIIYSYDMWVKGRSMSVSLATVEFFAEGSGTRMKLTEQGAFYGSKDDPANRREGTEILVDQIGAWLQASG